MSIWFEFFGRLHPMVLHLPIGLIAGLILLEIAGFLRRQAPPREFAAPLVWLTAATSLFSTATGFVLSYEGNFSGDTLDNHLRLGILVGLAALATAVLHLRTKPTAYRIALLFTAALLVPTGHLGASMTHGADFLTEPFTAPRTESASPAASAPAAISSPTTSASVPEYAAIAPILASRCNACHSVSRSKGGLRLDSPEQIAAGGDEGPVIVPGNARASELVRRLRLPIDEDGHMPPSSKPQPDEDEIRAIEAWIAAGATMPSPTVGSSAVANTHNEPTPDPDSVASPALIVGDGLPPLAPAPPLALAALRQSLVHVEPIAAGSNHLWVDFAAVAPQFADAEVAALLAPILEQVHLLSLARARITDATGPLMARMPNLHRLDVRSTPVSTAFLEPLRNCPRLESLVLSQTALTDAAIDALLALPTLQHVTLWNCGISADAIARLRAERPTLQITTGQEPLVAPLGAEGELKFSSDAPLPGASSAALTPANIACPVTGAPVDPKYVIVHEGRIIGFCCPNCPREFWSNPHKYPPKP
ncbi:MAG: c-type cytochrome domain-containing protein [Phycisphaerae bacterium]